jgi:hypothetical protein
MAITSNDQLRLGPVRKLQLPSGPFWYLPILLLLVNTYFTSPFMSRIGRPPGRVFDKPFQMRVNDAFLERVDQWRLAQDDQPSRAEAIRRLVELALNSPSE